MTGLMHEAGRAHYVPPKHLILAGCFQLLKAIKLDKHLQPTVASPSGFHSLEKCRYDQVEDKHALETDAALNSFLTTREREPNKADNKCIPFSQTSVLLT